MAQSVDPAAELASVTAPLNYLIDTGVKQVTDQTGAKTERTGKYQWHDMASCDGRPVRDRLSLDREGFALVDHATAVTDFFDEGERARVYDREVEALIKAHTGAKRVVVFDHTLRADSEDTREARSVNEPVRVAHNDYTDRSGPQRVRDLLPDEADDLLSRRFAIINVWRAIERPVETTPLALCDARTIAGEQLVPTERRTPGRVGEVQLMTYRPANRWFYFPRMRPDEAVLIKCFDSATDGIARFAAHSAFDDPTTPPDALPRQSIETRTFAFF